MTHANIKIDSDFCIDMLVPALPPVNILSETLDIRLKSGDACGREDIIKALVVVQ